MQRPDGSTLAYAYDEDGTLTEEYRYDANGNRTYQTNTHLGFTGRIFTTSTEDHIITAGTVTYQFDDDDQLAVRTDGSQTTHYSYSSTGELMHVTLPDAKMISYLNDPLGRRIAKKVNGTVVEKYLWSGRTTLLAVYDGSNALLQRFEYADGRLPYAMTMGGSTSYLAYDQVGSLRLITDSSGNTIKQLDYDSFGNIISDSDPAFTVPFGFAGGLHDRDTHLVRFGFRDYMPEIGKWTAKDPIGFDGADSNLFGYVANDPVNSVDPWGLESWITYDQNGNATGETGIEPNPFIDPTTIIGEAAGLAKIIYASGSAIVNEGIYVFISASWKIYVGQSGNIARRIAEHIKAGKLLSKDASTVKCFEVKGGKLAREIAEQKKLTLLAGSKILKTK